MDWGLNEDREQTLGTGGHFRDTRAAQQQREGVRVSKKGSSQGGSAEVECGLPVGKQGWGCRDSQRQMSIRHRAAGALRNPPHTQGRAIDELA